jgi:sorbitol-specific phosphotransferase system component IIA
MVIIFKESVPKDINGVRVELPSETRPQELGADYRISELEANNRIMI